MLRSQRHWSVALVLLAIACGKSETPPAPGKPDTFSAEAERQIRALIAEKDGRTPAQQKIESRLIHAMKTFLGEPMAPGVGQFESNVQLDEGYVRVDIRSRGTDAVARAVEASGGTVIDRFERYNSVTARVPIANLEHIADEGAVLFIAELLEPELSQELPFKKRAEVEPPPATTDVLHVSQGVVTHGADTARTTYGARGQGVKVGVLSDSVDNLATMQASGDLGPVTVLPGQAGTGTGEGTAMLEIVHDMAPDAELFFATALGGTANFANNIIGLRNAGCDIIVDDVMYFNESPFQDALVAQAVNAVIASGGIYVSSAGNSGSLAKGTSGVYQGDFVDSGTPITGLTGAINRFDNGMTNANNDLVSAASSSTTAPTTLSWSDPLAGSNNDYDLFVLNNALTGVLGFSTTVQSGSQDPYEQIVGPQTTNSRVVVLRKAGAQSRFLHVNTNRGRLGIATNGQTRGHSAAASALSVAATPAATAFGAGSPTGPFPGVFTTASQLEIFSSDGARKMFFNANGSLANSGNPSLLSDGGIVRQKPDITGADGVTTSFNPFFGTSAAAPHIAGIAAILKSAVPSATATQIRTAITSSALDIETPGVDVNSGAGIAMAMPALAALGAVPSPSLSVASRTVTPIGGNGNATWEPGENANLSITLANAGVVAAQSVNATLTTSAPNLTITQATSAYPNIAVGESQANSTLFGLRLSNVAACAPVPVHLAVTYTGGSAAFDLTLAVGSAGSPVIVPYGGPVVPIPDGTPGAGIAVPLSVSGLTGVISDVNFRIDGTSCTPAAGATTVGIDHTWVGDLALTLTSPTGTVVGLVNRLSNDGGLNSGNNFCGTVLDDAAVTTIQSQLIPAAPFTGTFKPQGTLSSFNGQNPNGTWSLGVRDFQSADTGNVRAFSLVITPQVCAPVPDLGTPCTMDTDCGSGNCSDGVCCDDACGDSNSSDCQACNAAGHCGAAPAATVCRASVGACDVQETCGGATTCPADAAVMQGTACGGAPSGDCDDQDTCTGTVGATATCTANFKTQATVCRVSAGTCDPAETCTGTSATCPGDVIASNGTVCRPGVGACDVPEACNGSSPTCGADAAVTPGTTCGGPPNGDCDAQDTCTGTLGATATCTPNFKSSSTLCRGSGGVCDVPETCTGSSTTCPADVLISDGTVCRPSVGACDVAEACNGTSPTCGADAAATPGTACGGPPNGDCDAQDTCSGAIGATATCAANFKPSSTVCRDSAGTCDVAENCTGSTTTCPADVVASNGTLCRPSIGACDVAEACNGTSATCGADAAVTPGTACGGPPNGDCDAQDTCAGTVGASATCTANFKSSSTLCRVSGGVCDVAENCTGSAATCPADVLVSNGTVCRPSVGACDVAEACNGASPTCGADAAVTPGTPCGGPPNGDCDAQDTCNGTLGASATCTANFKPSSTVCRVSGGACDVPESCTGGATTCPANAFVAGGTECRAAQGLCDVAEQCTGSGPACPADGFVSATTVCRPSGGDCDPLERCTGSAAGCPSDVLATAGTLCRSATGECDLEERCDGVNAACATDGSKPTGSPCGGAPNGDCDAQDECSGGVGVSATCLVRFSPASTVCRDAAGDCDLAEHCTGAAATCPADGFVGASTECRPSAGVCDVAENCTGTTAGCPANGFAPSTTTCSDGSACTAGDLCNGSGACQSGTAIDCEDNNPCTAERCDSLLGCVHDPVASGTSCSDGNACTQGDVCSAGVCRGTGVDCDDDNPCTADSCDISGACVHVPSSTGGACDDGNRCTVMEACGAQGACVGGQPLDCNDDNECTTDSCLTSSGCAHQAVQNGTSCAGGDGVCQNGDCDTGGGGAGGAAGEGTGGTAGRGGSATGGRGGSGGASGGTAGSGAVAGDGGEGGEAGEGVGGTAGRGGSAGTSVGGLAGEGGDNGAGEPGIGGTGPKRHPLTTQTSGCGCHVPGGDSGNAGYLAWLVVPLALSLRRRRAGQARNPRRNSTSS